MMKKRTWRAAALLVSALVVFPASGQMDMLPFIFRDIPPEIEQGIPAGMSYDEFGMLNRNVDFVTMGMSMMLPGYGFFQVKKPALGWAVAGGRAAAYGLMAAGVVRQWTDFRDLGDLDNLTLEKYNNAKENLFLFSAGVFLNFTLWGLDVLGAYHVAKEEKDFVIYKYGLAKTLEDTSADRTARKMELIRSFVRQDDPLLRQRTISLLHQVPREGGRFTGEAEWLLAEEYRKTGNHAAAIVHLLRGIYLAPGSPYLFSSRSRAIDILSEQTYPWDRDRAVLWKLLYAAPGADVAIGRRVVMLISSLSELSNSRIGELMVLQANEYLSFSPVPEGGDEVLQYMAEWFGRTDKTELEAQSWAKVVTFYPESGLFREALEKALKAYGDMGDQVAVSNLEALR